MLPLARPFWQSKKGPRERGRKRIFLYNVARRIQANRKKVPEKGDENRSTLSVWALLIDRKKVPEKGDENDKYPFRINPLVISSKKGPRKRGRKHAYDAYKKQWESMDRKKVPEKGDENFLLCTLDVYLHGHQLKKSPQERGRKRCCVSRLCREIGIKLKKGSRERGRDVFDLEG